MFVKVWFHAQNWLGLFIVDRSEVTTNAGVPHPPSRDYSLLKAAVGYDGEQDVWDHGHKRVVEDDEIDALLDDALSDSSNMPIIDD